MYDVNWNGRRNIQIAPMPWLMLRMAGHFLVASSNGGGGVVWSSREWGHGCNSRELREWAGREKGYLATKAFLGVSEVSLTTYELV